ncbi:MAG: aspartate ammonia-lyase, partial [Kiritimatiellia bacterium]|nr:aspartate ammonia-lyase [Kiritimatiellia bacterium]
MRIEKDSLGRIPVPDEALYGAGTARSMSHFDVAGEPMPREILQAMFRLKWACAEANRRVGGLPEQKASALIAACREALDGRLDSQFPLDVLQAGSGTSSNMNVNEVLANRACEILGGKRGDRGLVHPNDDVNRGQSTNNIFPSALRVACVLRIPDLFRELDGLVGELRARQTEFADVLKCGRTHLQDAVPVTLGQEFGAWARALEKARGRIEAGREGLLELGVGGNAIGTGLNTSREFRPAILDAIAEITGAPFRIPVDGIEITQFLTDLAQFSAALRLLAADIRKICGDLRLLASGPNTAIGEIRLPAVEPGSSIMPGKVNPSICEAATMACLAVMGYDHAVSLACADGQLELNTHMPVVGWMLMRSIGTLERTCRMLAVHGIRGIEARRDVCALNFERSAGLATILNPRLGYDRVAELVKESLATGQTLRELALAKKLITPDE